MRALILEAAELSDLGQDLGRAYRLLKRAEALAGGSDSVKKQLLTPLASVSANLGRFDEALEAYARLAELARSTQDMGTEARVRFAFANLALRRSENHPAPGGRSCWGTPWRSGARRKHTWSAVWTWPGTRR
ncbi:hypothetical protein [Stigmatella erecta]|uniref:Tetratricopeptide repeat-containing protein n=1 Tax=Stigmatella erecta TaxID=83460 RepID=A0A1I0CP86_9BACT|nr:hypothetical protein [Stigmatella erecta]SET21328.1 hypothetical protein SAMN05443639_102196 [Stigmatella erecta]